MFRLKLLSVAILAVFAAGLSEAGAQSFRAAKGNLCIDIAGGRLAPGTPIMLWKCHGKFPQKFQIDAAGGQIRAAAATHLCVDDISGQGLALFDCNTNNSSWAYDRNRQEIRRTDGMCWDVPGGQFKERQRLKLWKCNSLPPQRFAFR